MTATELRNLLTRCRTCNQRKADRCDAGNARAALTRRPADRFERAGRLIRRATGSTPVNPMAEHAELLASYAATLCR